jgi:hypothetical protein
MKSLRILLLTLALISALAAVQPAQSQCSMCRAVAESGTNSDATRAGKGLNNGILYLLAMPYVLGGVAFFIWYRNRRKNAQTA